MVHAVSGAGIDLLTIDRGTVTAPAGCGKTHLIAESLKRHLQPKPILILTHTNAGVAALRGRLDKASVPAKSYRLSTIDGWVMRLVGLFPVRSGVAPDVLSNSETDYPAFQKAARTLLKGGHVNDVLAATYDRLIVDEYQDCTIPQHAIVYYAAQSLPSCILGDPMQAIFGWQGNEAADWHDQVCKHFPIRGQLADPWRWTNAGTDGFGRWLLQIRAKLETDKSFDIREAPPQVTWIELDGQNDHPRQLRAGSTPAPESGGTVMVIASSTPQVQRNFASQIPGAVTVEAVNLTDLVTFARTLDFTHSLALDHVVDFAAKVMTKVGPNDLIRRVDALTRGSARNAASTIEKVALAFQANPCPRMAVELLVAINQQSEVREYRPAVLRSCIRALNSCDGSEGNTFHDAAIRAREQNRLIGRPLAKRVVGSTLLLKGLEADVAVILNAADHDAKNLYVAMTRGAKRLVICSKSPVLNA